MIIPKLRFKPLFVNFLFIFIFQLVSSQEVMLYGIVSDSIQPLANANIIAFPNSSYEKTKFAISNKNGAYRLQLLINEEYVIKISYLGYRNEIFNLSLQADTKKDIILESQDNLLDEVTVSYKIPVQIKEDTIIYDVDAFVNGKERKLREVLKKLPGVEVDKEGNVRVKGKKINKVMVEDKVFFTGNSKLAVNNIPADAVAQIEILDNYNEVGFLKGLQDSDQIAMNIRLKKDKKQFAFGNLEAGMGIKNRYSINPTLFYYSEKTNINLIGDLNNTGKKSFTTSDYIEFEGGFGKLMGNIKGFVNLFNDDFSKYLANTNFKENTNQFGAFNLRKTVSPKTSINTYIITNGSKTKTETKTLNQYSGNVNLYSENRTNVENLKNFFVIGKLTFDYKPSTHVDLSANSFVKISDNNSKGNIITTNPFQNNNFQTSSTLNAVSLKQNLEYSKKLSSAQTFSLETTLHYKKNKPNVNWLTNESFLNNLIPLEDDSVFNVFQQIETQNTTFDFILKDYWILNNLNHIYTSIGTNIVSENYTSVEEQQLSNGSVNNFSSDSFGNDLSYSFNDIFLGLEYKNLTGIFTTKAGVFYHNYRWRNKQLGIQTSKQTTLLLPEFSIEAEFNSSKKLKFNYQANTNFPNSPKLIGNFLLTNFNQVLRGNSNLANEKYHTLSLNYSEFSFFRGFSFNAGVFYNKKTQSIKSAIQLQGIEQFRTLTLFNLPENSITSRFNFSKKINTVRYSLETDVSYNEFFQIVNDNTSKNISKSLSATGRIETFFKKTPNFELGYSYSPSIFITKLSTSNFTNNELFVNLEYDFFKDFQFKANYSIFDYKNIASNSSDAFDIANASLLYQKEDSVWSFQIETTNLFNSSFRRSNSFSDILISDQTKLIIPRIILLKISYKL